MDGSTVSPLEDIFQQLAALPRWVSYKLTYNEKRGKYDKIPYGDRAGLSTAEPADWKDLITAAATAQTVYGLSGVGFVMTGGVEVNGLTLAGFDFDDVTPEWTPPFKSYAEHSPSKKGARMFAWVPSDWAKRYQDTLDTTPPNCGHCEIYLGTAPRFLTVTFDNLNQEPIAELKGCDLLKIGGWGLHDLEAPKAETATPSFDVTGTAVDLTNPKFRFTKDQKHLINGDGEIDRSNVMLGFLVKLLDHSVSQEDALATILSTETLWSYCMSHRNQNEDRALTFAKEEISRAWAMSMTGKRAALSSFNKNWGDKPMTDSDVLKANPKTDDLGFPMHVFKEAPGLVGEIARWIVKAVKNPREEYAYACALSLLACLVGTRCTVDQILKLNLYLTLVGGTGAGKTEAIGAMGRLLAQTLAKDCILDFPASEAAMRRQLTVTPNIILKIDEISQKLQAMKDNPGSGMGRALLEGYDGERMPPKVYADSKNSLPAVEDPFVQVIGGTTGEVWEVVKKAHLNDGTLNRFVFVCAPEESVYRVNQKPQRMVPKELIDKLNAFWRAGRHAALTAPPQDIGYEAEVENALGGPDGQSGLGKEMHAKQQEEYGNLYPRLIVHTKKIAALLAIGSGRDKVSMADYQQALSFMRWSVANTHDNISDTMADGWFERQEKRIVKFLRKAGGKLRENELCAKMHMFREDLAKILNTMAFHGRLSLSEPEVNHNKTETVWVTLL